MKKICIKLSSLPQKHGQTLKQYSVTFSAWSLSISYSNVADDAENILAYTLPVTLSEDRRDTCLPHFECTAKATFA